MPRVVGIDPSLTATALVGMDESACQERVLVIEGTKLKGLPRLDSIREQVISFIDHEMPELVVIEGFAYNAKGASVFEMGGLGWLLRWTMFKMQQPFLVAPPSVLKSFATGKGNSAKEIMIREVYRKWKYEAKDNNDADAYALAKLGLDIAAPKDKWTKKTTDLFSKCESGK